MAEQTSQQDPGLASPEHIDTELRTILFLLAVFAALGGVISLCGILAASVGM